MKVLAVAYRTVRHSKNDLVGLEDLWTAALKEGKTLFKNSNLWKATYPSRTHDMLGQTSIGPWQLTLSTARKFYPMKRKPLTDSELLNGLEQNPETQAEIAASIFESSYKSYGQRSPMAIQNYFWLEPFQKKEIAQGPWYASVLAINPQDRRNTGFYAKQFLLGSRFNPEGLLYWLYITRDHTAVREALRTWSEAGYPIHQQDLAHCSCPSDFQKYLRSLLVIK